VRNSDGRWTKHNTYEIFGIRINSDGTIATELDVEYLDIPYPQLLTDLTNHGNVMRVMWVFVGMTLLISRRYLTGSCIYCMNLLHSIFGVIVCAFTILSGVMALNAMGPPWKTGQFHGWLGILMMVFALILASSGIALVCCKQKFGEPWKPDTKANFVRHMHKLGGYLALFAGNYTVFAGAIRFDMLETEMLKTEVMGIQPNNIVLLVSFVVAVIVFEVIWRVCQHARKKKTPTVTDVTDTKLRNKIKEVETAESIEKKVKDGR